MMVTAVFLHHVSSINIFLSHEHVSVTHSNEKKKVLENDTWALVTGGPTHLS